MLDHLWAALNVSSMFIYLYHWQWMFCYSIFWVHCASFVWRTDVEEFGTIFVNWHCYLLTVRVRDTLLYLRLITLFEKLLTGGFLFFKYIDSINLGSKFLKVFYKKNSI